MDVRSAVLRVELFDGQDLIREALSALIQKSQGLELAATASTVADAVGQAAEFKPDVALLALQAEPEFFAGVSEIRRRSPQTKVILLDDSPSDANVREALRIGVAGYLTKQQTFAQIEAALLQSASGDRVFAPEIARRLVLSSEGIRLPVADRESPLCCLTQRETEVLAYLAQGYSVKRCAEALGIGISTVGNHKSRLMKKLNIHKVVDLTRLAIREGLISIGSRAPTTADKTPGSPRRNRIGELPPAADRG
jgi:DNA-binding NarL/FixJ family response regulator